ncbi:hypothetical protein [Escherichia sp. E3659]|uniref:hypothetical protein n=1 Tax=Escherichia sp. E3659 TaxID=2044462 RepID=UPI0014369881|nr:hypothetical protein [Escherichia sp. E3659]
MLSLQQKGGYMTLAQFAVIFWHDLEASSRTLMKPLQQLMKSRNAYSIAHISGMK